MLTCAYVMRHNIEMLSQELAVYCGRSFTNASLLPGSVSPSHTFALPLFATPTTTELYVNNLPCS